MASAAPVKGLSDGFEAKLDAHFQAMVSDPAFPVPGVVVQLRRGPDSYCKAFGFADKEAGRKMESDAMIRMWSMTKVLTCATALRLYERGLFKLDDPVADYVESFRREWEIVKPSDSGSKSVDYYAFVAGETKALKYDTVPATHTMRIKHLMSETSGIEYDQFSDYDEFNGGALGCGWGGGVASALRQQQNPDVYRSTNILGADCTLAEFCDHIATAGVLVCEPGEFSYGVLPPGGTHRHSCELQRRQPALHTARLRHFMSVCPCECDLLAYYNETPNQLTHRAPDQLTARPAQAWATPCSGE